MSCGEIKGESWTTIVRKWGNTSGITIPRRYLGKKVQITIYVIEE